jgi:hypothetical protein
VRAQIYSNISYSSFKQQQFNKQQHLNNIIIILGVGITKAFGQNSGLTPHYSLCNGVQSFHNQFLFVLLFYSVLRNQKVLPVFYVCVCVCVCLCV